MLKKFLFRLLHDSKKIFPKKFWDFNVKITQKLFIKPEVRTTLKKGTKTKSYPFYIFLFLFFDTLQEDPLIAGLLETVFYKKENHVPFLSFFFPENMSSRSIIIGA